MNRIKKTRKDLTDMFPPFVPGINQKAATRKGARHDHKPTHKARRMMPITPAQYRHHHFGMTNKKEAKNERSQKPG